MAEQIIDALAELFADDVVVEARTLTTGDGVPTYAAAATRKARVTGHHRMVRDAQGQERVSTVKAVFAGAFGLTTQHRYTLPVRFTPRQPEPIAVGHSTDENGPHHDVVFF